VTLAASSSANLARIAAEEAAREADVKKKEAETEAARAQTQEINAKHLLAQSTKREEKLSRGTCDGSTARLV
jgi:hypothetical protein